MRKGLFLFRSAVIYSTLTVLVCALVVGCKKKEDVVAQRDTTRVTTVDSIQKPAEHSGDIRMLNPDEPDAKPPFPMTPGGNPSPSEGPVAPAHEGPNQGPTPPVGAARILSSGELEKLQPVSIPGYTRDTKLTFSRDVPNVVSKSTAIYRDANDPNHTVRITIVDQNERFADNMIKEIMQLEANDGKKVSVSPSGETITAYEVHVNGTIGASSYIASEHVATLSLVVGDHRLVQFREQPATSRDHLLEVAKSFDIKRYEDSK